MDGIGFGWLMNMRDPRAAADVLHWLDAPTAWVRRLIYMAHYLTSSYEYSWLDKAHISPSGRRPERGSKGRDTTDLGDPKFDELYIQPLIELAQNDQNGPGQLKARVYSFLAEPERFTNWDLICFSVELKFIPTSITIS